jgi:sulfonate transport system substrate-binding protein
MKQGGSTIDRRGFAMGMGALALGACARRDPALVLGDQMHLLQSKLDAAHVLDGPVQWANFQGAAPLFEALNAGAVDTAPAADLPVIAAAVGGCALRIGAVARSRPDSFGIVVPGPSPAHRIADLAGRTVIVSSARGSITHYLLLEALREVGLTPDAVHIGFMLPTDAASAFAAGKIDAWVTFGVYLARAEAAGARVLRNAEGLGPGYSVIAVGTGGPAADQPARRRHLGDVLRRIVRANDWARGNTEAYAAVYSHLTDTPLPIARIVVARESTRFHAPDARFVADVQQATDRFVAYGIYPHSVSVAALADPALLNA